MRVIAGTAKGRRLGPVPAGTRPVSDRAREGVFNSLGGLVEDATCLDLYAGTGALGIEALSRGAARCTFVDRSAGAVAAVRANLERTGLAGLAAVVRAPARRFLEAGRRGAQAVSLAFVDPPYAEEPADLELVAASLDAWLDREGWTVVMTRGQKSPLPAVPVHWAARRHLRYGDSLVILYTEVGWA